MNVAPSNDPQWDLAIEIAAKLWLDGEFVIELDPIPTQRLVDLQWAARQAGRALGGRARVRMSRPRGPKDPTVTVTVTYVEPAGRARRGPEEGLEAMMRHVLEAQAER
jgi:hypothetical protein